MILTVSNGSTLESALKQDNLAKKTCSSRLVESSYQYIPHDPITVHDDAELAAVADSGTGTENDPYILGGWLINTSMAHGINITGTTEHFIIRDCWISTNHQNIGVYLDKVASGTANIVNNTCHDNEQGIYIINTNSTVITNNTCIINHRSGIVANSTVKTNITGNLCSQNGQYGIQLDNSTSDYVTRNSFVNNGQEFEINSHVCDSSGSGNVFSHNYFGNWTSPDTDGDGFVDNPYTVDGDANNHDNYPRVTPNHPHYIISPVLVFPQKDQVVDYPLNLNWSAAVDSLGFNVKYDLYYSYNDGDNWIQLITGLLKTYYRWDTSKVDDGHNYRIKVEATSMGGLKTVFITDVFTVLYQYDHTITQPTTSDTVGNGSALFLMLYSLLAAGYYRWRKKGSKKSV